MGNLIDLTSHFEKDEDTDQNLFYTSRPRRNSFNFLRFMVLARFNYTYGFNFALGYFGKFLEEKAVAEIRVW